MRQGAWRVDEPMQQAGVGDGFAALQIVCAWCQQSVGWHQVQTPTRFTISYTICARCYGDVVRESETRTVSTASTPGIPADRREGSARHRLGKHQEHSFLQHLTEDVQQRAKALCLQATDTQQRAQEIRQTYLR